MVNKMLQTLQTTHSQPRSWMGLKCQYVQYKSDSFSTFYSMNVNLLQMRITGSLPSSIFYSTAALVTASLAMSIYQIQEQSAGSCEPSMTYYSNFLGIVGVSSLAQVPLMAH